MINFTKEQIFVVTGASSGIGETTAIILNELGATVIAIARNMKRLEEMKEKCKYPENMHIEIKDLTEDIDGLPKYIKELKEKYGKFSGMVYSAGVSALCPHKAIDKAYVEKIFNINYCAPLLMVKGMTDKRNNIGKGTSIVCLSSIDAVLNSKGQCVYSGSKAALSASMSAISKEVCPQGVRINCVLPSMIKTPMTTDVKDLEQNQNDINPGLYPFGWGKPDDVANMIIFLLSDKSNSISGKNYIIDSGGVI